MRPEATEEQQAAQRDAEARAVWQCLAAGTLRSAHFHDGPGALLLFETTDKAEAQRIVDELPMVKAGILDVELFALAPFVAFEDLFNTKADQ